MAPPERRKLFQLVHDGMTGGHLGLNRTKDQSEDDPIGLDGPKTLNCLSKLDLVLVLPEVKPKEDKLDP